MFPAGIIVLIKRQKEVEWVECNSQQLDLLMDELTRKKPLSMENVNALPDMFRLNSDQFIAAVDCKDSDYWQIITDWLVFFGYNERVVQELRIYCKENEVRF